MHDGPVQRGLKPSSILPFASVDRLSRARPKGRSEPERDDRTGKKGFVQLIRASDTDEEIAAERDPSEMWMKPSSKKKKLKDIFMAIGLFAVSSTFADMSG
ncbi:hypothetical protein [Jannaschia rubra]|uniref:hypothetical protein n=1 Tax=Jannaschia rubra TaxID=282197 RepID=UPI0024923265|nr:hypothetical protein [Jannaschia rubra]